MEPVINFKSQLMGMYTFNVYDVEGNLVSTKKERNTLTNFLLNNLFSINATFISEVKLGLNDTPESPEQVDLLGVTTGTPFVTDFSVSNTAGLDRVSKTFDFGFGTLNGVYKEIGVFDTLGNMISRHLITPGLEIIPEQRLVVEYSLFAYYDVTRQDLELTITNLGSFTGDKGMFSYRSSTSQVDAFMNIRRLLNPTVAYVASITADLESPVANNQAISLASVTNSAGGGVPMIAQPYTEGSFERDFRAQWTSSNEFQGYGFVIGNISDNITFAYLTEQEITKDDSSFLRVFFRISWEQL